ncbi:MAG: 7,8-didemethyl-8-hydroxy-5-deazariboflavin synthase subunit CofG [Deltaproteobacteria bacterium]|nr:7,8-didemethyl-8-hydroxy-5-deazariboflavin synthase subunit CofG [Deltaproteobacteria bacterium]
MLQLLKDCLNGKQPDRDEAYSLTEVQGDDLSSLLLTASALRDLHKGRVVTFSAKIFVPLTNLCRDFCGYCTFRKAPGEPGAKSMTLDEVLRVVRQGKALGCTEVLFSLGDKPEAIYPEMKQFLAERGHQRTPCCCPVLLMTTRRTRSRRRGCAHWNWPANYGFPLPPEFLSASVRTGRRESILCSRSASCTSATVIFKK